MPTDQPRWFDADAAELLRSKQQRAHRARQDRVDRFVAQIVDHRSADPDCEAGPGCPGHDVIRLLQSIDYDDAIDLALAALIGAAEREQRIAGLDSEVHDLTESIVKTSGTGLDRLADYLRKVEDNDRRP